ncbi:hypothetical protein [Alteromonas abrolhosensis]|uniref:hypothetical protein n=2 Tax=Alteromonas abrolhosensis TaxID=1892904 RepID=UPI00131B983D|nr:hypothetical protein [Alteromonas abrolhosensis]
MMKELALLMIVFLTAGCATHVYYVEQASSQEKVDKESINIFVDAFGSIYPKSGLDSNIAKSIDKYDGLYELIISEEFDCTSIKASTEVEQLCTIKDKQKALDHWRIVQNKIWKSRAKHIYQSLIGTERELIVLIHGYNNNFNESSNNFELFKEHISKYAEPESREFLFVNIHWDGFEGNPISGAWSRAQSSGPLVGFQLRQLFNLLAEQFVNNGINPPSLKIFTHSSGAFIVGGLLGNPYYALPNLQQPQESEYKLFRKYRKGEPSDGLYRIPTFSSVTVGMIAAATPTSTFNVPSDKEEHRVGLLAPNSSLVFSINSRDIALGKLFRISNLSFLGATGAGADKKLFCRYLSGMPEAKQNVLSVNAIEFEDKEAPWYSVYDEHSLGGNGYFARIEETKSFFDSVLNERHEKRNLINCN